MRLSTFGIVAVLTASLAAPARAIARPQAATAPAAAQDKALDARIEKRIKAEPALAKHDIKVDVKDGVVTLSGTVATEAERTKAGDLAKISGITRVDNKIVADLDAATRTGVKGTTGKIADKTKDTSEKVVDKTKQGVSKTGEVITDSWITTRIKTKFMGEESLRASDISVETNDHVVTLSGTVVSAVAHAKAITEAKDVEGVHRVVDKLKIVPKS